MSTISDSDRAAIESGRKTYTEVRFQQWVARSRGVTVERLTELERNERKAQRALLDAYEQEQTASDRQAYRERVAIVMREWPGAIIAR